MTTLKQLTFTGLNIAYTFQTHMYIPVAMFNKRFRPEIARNHLRLVQPRKTVSTILHPTFVISSSNYKLQGGKNWVQSNTLARHSDIYNSYRVISVTISKTVLA